MIIILLYSTSKPQKCQGLYQKAGVRHSVQLAARISLLSQINYGAKPKVSLKPFQRLAESRDSVSGRRSQFLESGEIKRRRSASGESENDSVNRFRRGDVLQVKQRTKSLIWIAMLYATCCRGRPLVEVRNWYVRGIIPRVVTTPFVSGRTECAPTAERRGRRSLHYISANCNKARTPEGRPYTAIF